LGADEEEIVLLAYIIIDMGQNKVKWHIFYKAYHLQSKYFVSSAMQFANRPSLNTVNLHYIKPFEDVSLQ
jgi:hypothetical protein